MAVVSIELNNGEVVNMTTEVLAYLIRKRHRMLSHMDAEPDSWITLENGEHVPLDANGQAIGGAGGWATGKNFSDAKKSTSSGKSRKLSVSENLKPKYEYKFSLDDDFEDFQRNNIGRRGAKGFANLV